MLIVTTESIPGYRIRSVLGEVHGAIGRSRNAYREGLRSLNRERVPDPSRTLAHDRDLAIDRAARRAVELGANAIVGMRFDHRDVTAGTVEICAYGTAVVVEAVEETPPPAVTAAPRLFSRGRSVKH